MDKYIVRKDYLLWSEKKRLTLLECIGQINKILENDSINKIELIQEQINCYTIKCNELAKVFELSRGDIDIKSLPIEFFEESKLIDLFHQILDIQ